MTYGVSIVGSAKVDFSEKADSNSVRGKNAGLTKDVKATKSGCLTE